MSDVEVEREGLAERSRDEILSPDAVAFIAELHWRFGPRRAELLEARRARAAELAGGATLDFLPETSDVRDDESWRVATPREDYLDRRVEITGPTDRKLVINALNSGAKGFMADFEDANSPTWANQVDGHANLIDAIEGTITYDGADGRHYELGPNPATLVPRPRGWHLPERHLTIDGAPASGSLVDFGLHAFHCARRLAKRGRGSYFYLPKLEYHLEARLWNDVVAFTEDALGLERGHIRATILIETLPAAFQMEEILFEMREHSYGLNAGRWDYIFSAIKTFRERSEFILPNRADVKMTVPFMQAYTSLLVRTCHRRGAFAMGGMAALIPSRTDPEANDRAVAAVRSDKEREAGAGFDGTWVAHPDVVGVAMEAFDAVLGDKANQIDRPVEERVSSAAELLDTAATPGAVTEAGLRNNISVGFRYISFWLGGRGAVGLEGMMEDAATAEICRAQIWQWVHHGTKLEDGRPITRDLVREMLDMEMERIHADVGDETWEEGRPEETWEVFERVALSDDFPEFLTTVAYPRL